MNEQDKQIKIIVKAQKKLYLALDIYNDSLIDINNSIKVNGATTQLKSIKESFLKLKKLVESLLKLIDKFFYQTETEDECNNVYNKFIAELTLYNKIAIGINEQFEQSGFTYAQSY